MSEYKYFELALIGSHELSCLVVPNVIIISLNLRSIFRGFRSGEGRALLQRRRALPSSPPLKSTAARRCYCRQHAPPAALSSPIFNSSTSKNNSLLG
jgi:hypothetical protein